MLSVNDLKAEIKEYSWDILTEGDEGAGEDSLKAARIWIKARLRAAGIIYDSAVEDTDEVVRQIVLSYALYHLYARAEQEAKASDKKAVALELMAAYLSAPAAKDPSAAGSGVPIGAISKPTRRLGT